MVTVTFNFRRQLTPSSPAALSSGDLFSSQVIATKILHGAEIYYAKEIPQPVIAVYTKLLEHAKAVLVGQLAQQTEATFLLLEKWSCDFAME